MSAPFQFLPPLFNDDLARLRQSIKDNGIQVPILVDENGEIIDGHHRSQIAAEIGIDCPRIVRAGLFAHDKRILAVELNLARRHLTDGQKAVLGRQIRPDIEARAAERRRATQNNESAKSKSISKQDGHPGGAATEVTSRGQMSITGTTRDEVAKVVGLGSGKTFERANKVIDELAAEPDGEQLVKHVEAGDWSLSDAKAELRTRHPDRLRLVDREQAKTDQRMSDELASRIISPNGPAVLAQRRAKFTKSREFAMRHLYGNDPDFIAESLRPEDMQLNLMFIRDVRKWIDGFEAALKRKPRLVGRETA